MSTNNVSKVITTGIDRFGHLVGRGRTVDLQILGEKIKRVAATSEDKEIAATLRCVTGRAHRNIWGSIDVQWSACA
jgi:hypothetical protein